MSDVLKPGDPLLAAAEALRHDQPIAPGMPERIARRRVRRRRQRQVAAIAASFTVIATIAIWPRGQGAADTPLALAPAPAAAATMTFTLDDPNAHAVALVGDFTDWQPDSLPLRAGKDGKWEVTVPIRPGRYRYAFVVDNEEWRADPEATLIPDDFGRPTSVLNVPSDRDQ